MEVCGKRCANSASLSPRRATRPRIAPRRAYSAASARPMPLEAPVMKTFNDEFMPAPSGALHFLLADLRDEVVEHLDRARQAVRVGRAGFVLALDSDRRHAVDLVVDELLLVALQRAFGRNEL